MGRRHTPPVEFILPISFFTAQQKSMDKLTFFLILPISFFTAQQKHGLVNFLILPISFFTAQQKHGLVTFKAKLPTALLHLFSECTIYKLSSICLIVFLLVILVPACHVMIET